MAFMEQFEFAAHVTLATTISFIDGKFSRSSSYPPFCHAFHRWLPSALGSHEQTHSVKGAKKRNVMKSRKRRQALKAGPARSDKFA
jgi:hypothetical protein